MIIENVILAEAKEAEGHQIKGIQEVADETTLQLFLDTSIDVLPVTLDHSESLLSKIGVIGTIAKDSLKVAGGKLLGTLKIADEAFTDKMFFVGKFLEELISKGRNEINISLESEAKFEFKDNLALIRPTSTTCASLVAQGALTSELFKKYSSQLINNHKVKETNTMTEELKKEDAPVVVPPVVEPKPEDKKPEDAKPEEKMAEAPVDIAKAISDLSAKVDAIATAIAQLIAQDKAEDAVGEPAMVEAKVEDPALVKCSAEKVKVEIKLAADIPESQSVVETDEDIMIKAKEFKYFTANASKVEAAANRLTKRLVTNK